MTAPPMRPWQNGLALAGALCAAGALLPLAPAARFVCAALAIATVVVLLAVRLRAHRAQRDGKPVPGVYDRIERIRAERAQRRRRPLR